MLDRKPRRIAVLGGAGGIGRALVRRLVADGDTVVVLDLAASLAECPPDFEAVNVDVVSEESVMAAAHRVGLRHPALDGFVYLAGYRGDKAMVTEQRIENFDEVMAVNLRGCALAAKHFLPLLRQSERASLVLTASVLAHVMMPGYATYSMSKAAVIALTKTLALEEAPTVRVNAIAPSAVDTPFLRGGTGRASREVQVDLDAIAAAIPLGRLATVDDVVGPTMFLLSDDSAFMTGNVLWITGGSTMP